MRVAVVGQGYVGLTVSLCLAHAGHRVTGVERDPRRLSLLRQGHSPFYEPGVEELLTPARTEGSLDFSESVEDLAGPPQAIVVAVGSPQLPSGGADLRDLATAMESILALSPPPDLIVVKSTVPPGTSRQLFDRVGTDLSRRYAYCPEFLSQGAALAGWRKPRRIVVGVENEQLLPKLRELYRGIDAPWVTTTPTNAEMIKYASNAFLATRISFINEIADLCDEVGGTIDDVVQGLALDPRIGGQFFRAGIGYGGSCFPKDVQALTHLSSLKGRAMPLLQSVVAVNNAQRLHVVRILREHVPPGETVAVLGLSFKADTDDIREAPSLTVIPELLASGYAVRVWDPVVPDSAMEPFRGGERFQSIEQASQGTGAIVVLTEWPHVADADWDMIARGMKTPWLVLDARNCLDSESIQALGLTYRGIGRGLRGGAPERPAPATAGKEEA